ncbi:PREDICTED: putative F-box/FBD/LRR-repeat protein At3g56780 [Prunus mume]|uniref:F-box/FBD/LRR-repeat protein At3g56780 n=1 Tax=Prunus mume TaxID=102107 RepID=A0ABM0P9N1_PRUMU|nr:PREDICTED: putative F-box/FBD/LRR-repeat protein At3g56780 [Prunus mume]
MATRKIPNHPNTKQNNLKGKQNSMATATIPHLPVLVIHHVLHFLPTKHAIRMSSLCKQWAGLWSSVPVLDLEEEDEPHEKFINFVDRCLEILEKYEQLDKFRLRMTLISDEDEEKVLECLRFAVERRVKELDIGLSFIQQFLVVGFLSPLLNAKSITSLNLENVIIDADWDEPIISLPSLKTLSLKTVRFKPASFISSLISCCPCIQHLSVTSSSSSDYDITSTDYCTIFMQTLLDAKSLTSLNLEFVVIANDLEKGPPIGRLPCLKTMSLTNVNMYYDGTLAQLISSSPSLEHLSVSISSPRYYNYSLPSSSLKSFEVRIFDSKGVFNSDVVRVIGAKSLESCTLVLESPKQIKRILFDRCENLKHLSIRAPQLPNFTLQLHGCKNLVNASLDIPKLYFTRISSNVEWRHFYSLANYLGKFQSFENISLYVDDAEALIFPKNMRKFYDPPLRTVNTLTVFISSPRGAQDSKLRHSLFWLGPESLSIIYSDL